MFAVVLCGLLATMSRSVNTAGPEIVTPQCTQSAVSCYIGVVVPCIIIVVYFSLMNDQ